MSLKERNAYYAAIDKAAEMAQEKLGGFINERKVEVAIAMRTGSPRLDHALGGGLAPGIVEIFGPESSGKTALAGFLLAMAQRQDKECALALTEDLDLDYWQTMGMIREEVALVESEDISDLVAVASDFLQGENRVMVIDSITALRPKQEGTMLEDFHNWVIAVEELVGEVRNRLPSSSCLILTSQVRAKKSIDPTKMFAGGTDSASRAIADSFATRLELSRDEVQDDSYSLIVNVISNVIGSPSRYVKLPIRKGIGVLHVQDLVAFAAECGVIERSGSWYVMTDGSRHQGLHAAAQALKTNCVLRQDLLDRMYQHI